MLVDDYDIYTDLIGAMDCVERLGQLCDMEREMAWDHLEMVTDDTDGSV